MIVHISDDLIQCRVRGHTYVVRGDVCPACAIHSWIDNPALDFTEDDGIALALYLRTASLLCNS